MENVVKTVETNLGGVEDLVISHSTETVAQVRDGVNVNITPINSSSLPYSEELSISGKFTEVDSSIADRLQVIISITELRLLDPTLVRNQYVMVIDSIVVGGGFKLYAFDDTNVEADNGTTIIKATEEVGRYLKLN